MGEYPNYGNLYGKNDDQQWDGISTLFQDKPIASTNLNLNHGIQHQFLVNYVLFETISVEAGHEFGRT